MIRRRSQNIRSQRRPPSKPFVVRPLETGYGSFSIAKEDSSASPVSQVESDDELEGMKERPSFFRQPTVPTVRYGNVLIVKVCDGVILLLL